MSFSCTSTYYTLGAVIYAQVALDVIHILLDNACMYSRVLELCGMNLWGDEVLSELAFHRRVTFVCCEERKENDGNMTNWLPCLSTGRDYRVSTSPRVKNSGRK